MVGRGLIFFIGGAMSDFAYVAAHPDMPGYYAVSSADPKYIEFVKADIKEWEREGAVVSIVTADQAREGMQKYWDAKQAKIAAEKEK
jgi:hypothetical protein